MRLLGYQMEEEAVWIGLWLVVGGKEPLRLFDSAWLSLALTSVDFADAAGTRAAVAPG